MKKSYDVFEVQVLANGSKHLRMLDSLNSRHQGKKALTRARNKGRNVRLLIGRAVK